MSSAIDWRPKNIPLPEPHLLGLGLGVILHRVRPVRLPGGFLRRAVGIVALSCGAGLAAASTRAAGTTELADPARLVTTGPYAISRHPMYVGWTVAYVGSALLMGTRWPLILLPGVVAVVHKEILAEEHRLERRFDEEYTAYAGRVRRYL
jgi:protein-S-isoprenylcysteine O-methyltransferase Ste14